ncbi:hypothetical protein E4U55_000248 [Claviceps digitariae]|nr:hypothetical protein E4U55_000248 [Claviceps digitariae]
MYASRNVCSRCATSSTRLAVLPTHRNGTVALFSSAAGQDSTAFERGRTHAQETTNFGSRRRPFSPRDKPASSAPSDRPARQKIERRSAVELFNDVVQRSGDSAAAASPGGSSGMSSTSSTTDHIQDIATSALDEWEIAAKMKELSEMPLEPREKLLFFKKNAWPQIKELRCRMPKHLYMSASMFLADLCDEVAQKGVPRTSLHLSDMLGTIGKWDLNLRNQLVLNLCHVLITGKLSAIERLTVVDELVDMWKHLSQLMRPSQTLAPGEKPVRKFVLPTVDEIKGNLVRAPSSTQGPASFLPTTRALASILIQFRMEHARELISGLLATLAVFFDDHLVKETSRIHAAPLLNLVSVALEHQPADKSYIRHIFGTNIRFPAAKLSEVQSYVVAQWPVVTSRLFSKGSAWRNPSLSSFSQQHAPFYPSSPKSIISNLNQKARDAYASRIPAAIISVWEEFKAQLARRPDLCGYLRENGESLDYWVFLWCAIRRMHMLQQTLGVMQQLQIRTTVRTYTNMLHGWKLCKDWQRIEALWQKLVDSGIKLDIVIWTGRISGLIEAGKPQAGIQALAEMQHLWTKAVETAGSAESAASIAIQPSIEVVNAALTGLMSIDRRAGNNILTWAGRQGIEPNVRTFNILLKESLRSSPNAGQAVESLLKSMKARNLEPDIVTFTIILEGLLGGMHGASADEQVLAVNQLLSDMRAAKLQPGRETYSKMLHAISSLPYGGADAAISAVQQHMRADGFSPSEHAVTILLERALARDPLPPNTGATIRAILEKHKLFTIHQGDRTLWERVVAAYAVTGEVSAAMDLFRQLARAGRPITSLPCLKDLLRALLLRHQNNHSADDTSFADAKEVVSVVLNHKLSKTAAEGPVDPERYARYFKHHFWHMAMDNSLIDWSIVPPDVKRILREASDYA